MGTLEGKVALVTGASRGLGAAIARAYAGAGAAVVCAARTTADAEAVAEEIRTGGGRALAVTVDVTREDEVAALVDRTVDTFGRLDVVVNNAGAFVHAARFPRLSEEEWDLAMDTNLKAPWLVAKHAAPRMTREGSVINVATGLAHVGPGRGASTPYAPYSLAKAALEDLTRVLAERVKPRVNALNPGVVRTEMSNGLGVPADVVTPAFVWLAGEESKDVNGEVIRAQDWLADRPHLVKRSRRKAAAG